MTDKFAFCLWYGPQYRFAFGIATKQQLHLTWIEKYGLCDYKCTTLPQLFHKAAEIQELDNKEGLALTIISDEMYEASMRIKHAQSKQKESINEITNKLETS